VAFPDLRVTVEDVIVDGDLIAARRTATGTNDGPSQDRAPTGRAVAWPGINIFRVACGRIVEVWSEMDTLGLRAQLEVPAAATPAP